jgi:hypothetical protein
MVGLSSFTSGISDTLDGLLKSGKENQLALGVGAAALAVVGGAYYWRVSSRGGYRKKPSSLELSGGSIKGKEIKESFSGYSDAYGKDPSAGILERERTTELVNTFYNLVTDLYEWGWGTRYELLELC